jgi:nucleoside-diphosphate-sugar epimerase
VSAYIGDGASRWPAAHRSDAAHLVRLGIENAPPGSVLHAVAEEGITSREIAEAIGRGLDLPVASVAREDTAGHFGWLGGFFRADAAASNAITRNLLGWEPSGPTLLEDLDSGSYYA